MSLNYTLFITIISICVLMIVQETIIFFFNKIGHENFKMKIYELENQSTDKLAHKSYDQILTPPLLVLIEMIVSSRTVYFYPYTCIPNCVNTLMYVMHSFHARFNDATCKPKLICSLSIQQPNIFCLPLINTVHIQLLYLITKLYFYSYWNFDIFCLAMIFMKFR